MISRAGLGYRAPFRSHLEGGHAEVAWLEVITENYLWDRGARRAQLERLRADFALAFHGVSLSIAGPDPVPHEYLRELRAFCDDFSPVRVSDHLCWSSHGAHHWHDLLPFPYDEANLQRVANKVDATQVALARPLVLENLSAYMKTDLSTMDEAEFLSRLSQKTGCGLLIDLNNLAVNEHNFGHDPAAFLARLGAAPIAQVHLAGHVVRDGMAIDTHSRAPNSRTWELWDSFQRTHPAVPYMIEWDDDIPAFDEVLVQLRHAGGDLGLV